MCYQIITNHNNYFPGDTYENQITGYCVELTAYIIADILYQKYKAIKPFLLLFLVSAGAGLALLINDETV